MVADEFHHIQAIYDYPWSFSTHRLHTFSSEPMVITTRLSLGKASQGLQLSQITVLMIEIFVEISIELEAVLFTSVTSPMFATVR